MDSVLLQSLNPTEGYVRDSTPARHSRCCSCDHVFVSQQPLRCDAHTYPTYVAQRDTQTHMQTHNFHYVSEGNLAR